MCDQCMSQNPTAKSMREMWFFDFREDSPRYLTYISDSTYRSTATTISPWAGVQGWSLRSCFFDLLHILYLGVARDLVANLLADFIDCDTLEGKAVHWKTSSGCSAYKCRRSSRMKRT